MSKIFINSIEDGYEEVIRSGLGFLGLPETLKSSTRICIKPNLTFPHYRPGVMTNPSAIEAVVRLLADYTRKITICESDSGGYNRFSMDEVFRATGIDNMASRYGVRVVNLSHETPKNLDILCGRRSVPVPLPAMLLEETDVFITMPVPKIHMNTGVSLSLKNQWGVIQNPSRRLQLHPYFNQIIYAINKSLPPSICIMDGRFGLNRSGPMKGEPIDLNWVLMSDNLFAADLAACILMRIDVSTISHLRFSLKRENLRGLEDISVNRRIEDFVSQVQFHLKREWTDYPGLLAFHSRFIAYLGYNSPLAGFLHWILYKFREPFYDYNSKKGNS